MIADHNRGYKYESKSAIAILPIVGLEFPIACLNKVVPCSHNRSIILKWPVGGFNSYFEFSTFKTWDLSLKFRQRLKDPTGNTKFL